MPSTNRFAEHGDPAACPTPGWAHAGAAPTTPWKRLAVASGVLRRLDCQSRFAGRPASWFEVQTGLFESGTSRPGPAGLRCSHGYLDVSAHQDAVSEGGRTRDRGGNRGSRARVWTREATREIVAPKPTPQEAQR